MRTSSAKKSIFFKFQTVKLVLSLVIWPSLFIAPMSAEAGVFSFFTALTAKGEKVSKEISVNSQNMPILQAVASPDPTFARGGGDITISGDALLPDVGPLGTQADIEDENNSGGQISIYVVRNGDTLGGIGKMFGVSVNTIIWANDLRGGAISPGQKLIILPVSGIQHTVKKGDTVSTVAKKYKVDVGEILAFNGLSEGTDLSVGDVLIIPDGEGEPIKPATPRARVRGVSGVPDYIGYYMRPISYEEGHRTQGLHGYNGIDIGASPGTPVRAAASGDVIIGRVTGWNGGYGRYVVISHGNGTQTLYGHMSGVVAQEGWHVTQGQIIGYVGNTGRSTGPHLHFETRGAKNPF